MNATETIAGWVAKTSYEDIPPNAVRAAKETVFDCLGLMLAGSVESLGQIIEGYVRGLCCKVRVIGELFALDDARGWRMNDFKGRHFEGEIVLWAVRW